MSVSSYLVCPSRKVMLALGKRLTTADRNVSGFAVGDRLTAGDASVTKALWKFLAETAGEDIAVKFSDDADFDEIASYREIAERVDEAGDIAIADFLREGLQAR